MSTASPAPAAHDATPVASATLTSGGRLGAFRILSDGRFWWSPELYRLLGFDPAAGRPEMAAVFARCHPDDRTLVGGLLAKSFHRDAPMDVLFRIRPPEAPERHVWCRAWCDRPAEGACSVVGVAMEATALVADRAEMFADARNQRFISENVSDAIGRYGLDGVLTSMSRACKGLFGYEPEEMVGTAPARLIHPDDRAVMWRATSALLRNPAAEIPPVEYRMRHRDGRWIWCESRPRLVVDVAGTPLEWIDVIREITERKAADEALAAARLQADAAAEAKTEFVANMSHELRTPLTSILGFARLLADSPKMDGEERRRLELVQAAGESLLAIVNDVLDFSKLDAGKVELAAEPFDPGALVSEAAALMSPTAASKGLPLVVHRPAPMQVAGDAARLRQVLLNLLGNALKFTERGQVVVGADWRAVDDGGVALRLWVEDTGVGIRPDMLESVFNRFAQADGSAARRFGGAGLGLAITRQLLTLMNGSVRASSDGVSGSRFDVELTLPQVCALAPPVAPEPVEVGGNRPLRLLLAEDNRSNQALVSALLQALDATLDIVDDGEQAVAAVRTGAPYDLILMDMQMPVVDGPSAARAIRALACERAATPILALTANVLPEQVRACREAGMDGHIAKPIIPALLFRAVLEHARRPPGEAVAAAA